MRLEIFVLRKKHRSENVWTEKKSWSKKINLEGLAEKYANYYIVEGNVAVRRKMSSIDIPSL